MKVLIKFKIIEMNRNTYFVAFLIISFFFSGCSKTSNEDPNITFTVDNEFKISMWETLSPNQRNFSLLVETIDLPECENTEIDYTISIENNDIIISLNDLIKPTNCIAATNPVNTSINIGTFPNDNYSIQVNLQEEIINKGQLTVQADQYELVMESQHGIMMENQQLLRVPEQTYWGYIGFNNNAQATAQDYIRDLTDLSQSRSFVAGDYGHFKLTNNQELELGVSSDLSQSMNFILALNEAESELQALVDNYRNTYGANIDIYLFSYKGEEL